MKIKGTITETLIVQKDVEVNVPKAVAKAAAEGDDEAQEKINTLIRDKAYEATLFSGTDEHGWEGIDTLEVEVEVEQNRKHLG